MTPRSHHDMGGQGAARVVPTEHDYDAWERRVDAMCVLLWGIKGTKKIFTVDEHRKNIEALPPQAYAGMSYYERWVYSLAQCLMQRGVVSPQELSRKLVGVIAERSHHDMGGLPAGKVERTGHGYEEWERRVDAMAVLLGTQKSVAVDQRRRNIEALAPQDYDAMSYYERWTMALAQSLLQRGLLTTEELARKMLEVEKRAGQV